MKKQPNIDRKPNEAAHYIGGTIEIDGVPTPLLFTEAEMKRPKERAAKQPEDLPPKAAGLGIFAFIRKLLPALALCVLLAGCLAPTQSTIREYDADGKLTKETVTSESVIKTITESTKGKTVIAWDNSWLAGMIFVPPGSSAESPFGALKMLGGKNDEGMITYSDNHDPAHLPEIIRSARAGELGITSDGIGATTPAGPVQ